MAVCPYGARHGPWGGIDRGDDSCVFISSVFTCVFERANDRSGNDTGDGELEPPIYPIYTIVYIVLRIYKSSIEYYTTMILMYGTRYYTRYQVFILLSLYSVYIIYIIYIYILYSTKDVNMTPQS